MVRHTGLLVLALTAIVAASRAVPARAQAVTSSGLDAALLNATDLGPGWALQLDNADATDPSLASAYRVFTLDQVGAQAGVILYANADGTPFDADTISALQDGELLAEHLSDMLPGVAPDFADSTNDPGPQGIGNGDSAIELTEKVNGVEEQVAADAWLHGNIIAIAVYAAPAATVDAPTALQQVVAIAQQQDAKLGS